MAIVTVFGIDMALSYVAPLSYDVGDYMAVGEDCPLWEDIANYSYAVLTCDEWEFPIEWYTMDNGREVKTAMDMDNMPHSAGIVCFELTHTVPASYL